MTSPLVVAAAIRISGIVASLPKPARHEEVIQAIWARTRWMPYEEGFLTSEGTFVNRAEALQLVKINGQPTIKESLWLEELYSENLW